MYLWLSSVAKSKMIIYLFSVAIFKFCLKERGFIVPCVTCWSPLNIYFNSDPTLTHSLLQKADTCSTPRYHISTTTCPFPQLSQRKIGWRIYRARTTSCPSVISCLHHLSPTESSGVYLPSSASESRGRLESNEEEEAVVNCNGKHMPPSGPGILHEGAVDTETCICQKFFKLFCKLSASLEMHEHIICAGWSRWTH